MIPVAAIRPAQADREKHSPNRKFRPDGAAIRCCILHATADEGNEKGAESWLSNPASQVSAHLHIRRDGSVTRLVPDNLRAWHAGRSAWNGFTDVNSISLGWEIANKNNGRETYTAAQYGTVARLAAHYIQQGIPLDAFVSHAAVALPPGRKTDPAGWDWERFRADTLAAVAPVETVEPVEPIIVLTPDPRPPEIVTGPAPEPHIPEIVGPVVVQPRVKPGRKTSEWKVLWGVLASSAVAIGLEPNPLIIAAAVLSAGINAAGYSLSRGQAKSVVTFVAEQWTRSRTNEEAERGD